MPSKPRARIEPPFKTVYPRLGWAFSFLVDGESRPATWAVTNPDVGTVGEHSGEFWAHPGYRHPRTELVATDAEGNSSRASVSVVVGPPPGDGPMPVDDYHVPPLFTSVPWNDPHGRRAVLLMTEALWQLPREFLQAVGSVALIRVPRLSSNPPSASNFVGRHFPFLHRAVLLSDEHLLQLLDPEEGEYTDADRTFVQVFIHELAHVALANRAIPDWERLALIGGLGTALGMSAPTLGISVPLYAGTLYARYFSALARRDLVTEYAELTGWVINNPNPLSWIWGDLTEPPNAVTGLELIGKYVGLRNLNRPTPPIPLGPGSRPLTEDEIEKHWEAKGFPSRYGGTDVHEDFADSVTALALGWDVIDTPAFAPRRKWIIDQGFWPKKWDVVEPGAVLDAWAKKNRRPLPNVYEWAVNFGNYSGRPRFPAQLSVRPPSKPRVTPPPVPVHTISAAAEKDAPATAPAAPADPGGWLGEGREMEYPWGVDDVRRSVELRLGLAAVAAHEDARAETLEPALARIRAEVAAMEVPFRTGAVVELLRAAECRGDGVLFLGEKGVPDAGGAAVIPGRRAEPGDLAVGAGGAVYLVVGADAEGRITALTGEPELSASGRVRTRGVHGKTLRYFWSPGREPRAWARPGAPAGEYADLPAALAQLVGLWGEREGRRRGSDLSVAGDFVAEVLTAAGLRHRGLAGSGGDGVREYLDGYGEGVRPLGKPGSPAPAVGDLVRLRREGLWGVCTRARGPGEPLDVLFQGGLAGHAGEEEDAVVLRHSVERRRLGQLWRPAGARRARGCQRRVKV